MWAMKERHGRQQPEQDLQRAILQHLEMRAVRGCFWFHVGNGGWRSPIEARIFKGLGVKAGVPDLIIIHGGRCYGLELKADRGRVTPAQRVAHALMEEAGATVGIAAGIDAAVEQLEAWGLLRGRSAKSGGCATVVGSRSLTPMP
jgi:hypothetical protein